MKEKKTPKRIAADIYDRYWSDVSRKPVSKQDPLPDIRPLIETAIIEAIEEERGTCRQIALEVEKQSAELMKAAPAPETDMKGKEYYRGRGIGAALIAQRIASRS